MTPTRLLVLWAVLSVPAAVGIAALLRACRQRTIGEEAEAFLRSQLGEHVRRSATVRPFVVLTALGCLAVFSYRAAGDLPRQLVAVATARDVIAQPTDDDRAPTVTTAPSGSHHRDAPSPAPRGIATAGPSATAAGTAEDATAPPDTSDAAVTLEVVASPTTTTTVADDGAASSTDRSTTSTTRPPPMSDGSGSAPGRSNATTTTTEPPPETTTTTAPPSTTTTTEPPPEETTTTTTEPPADESSPDTGTTTTTTTEPPPPAG